MAKYRVIENDNNIRIETRGDMETNIILVIERQGGKYTQESFNLFYKKLDEIKNKYEFEFLADRRTDETIKEDKQENYYGIKF